MKLTDVRGVYRLQRAARWVRERLRPTAILLIYHRVARLPADPYCLAVTPEHFSEHLEVLRRDYHPLRLDDLVAAWRAGRLPQRAVAVTLDDGYADCLHEARPLFARHDVPATLFAVSGRIRDGRPFWWDELETLLLQPGALPAQLMLCVGGKDFCWELEEAAHYSAADWEEHRQWNYERKNAPTARQRLFHELWQLLHSLPEAQSEAVMEELFAWASRPRATSLAHRAMTPAELARLAEGGLVEIGAHTVTHPVLARLSATEQRRQIEQSKAELEEMLGQPVTSFSYPHGQRGDYTAETVALTRAAGFASSCAAFGGSLTRDTDRFQLPRNSMPDCDGDQFAQRLASLFDAA